MRRCSRSSRRRARVAPANTNLGIALLLAPLAKAALAGGPLRERLGATLRALDVADARAAYEAIRLAGAGGLRERVEHDVRSEPAVGLREAMASAAARDSIASEYVTDYALTFETGVPALVAALGDGLAVRDGDRRAAPAAARPGARHADRAQARRRRGGTGVGGRARGARRRRRAHRRRAPGAAELRRLAARAGQRAQPGDDRRPRDRDAVRRAGRGYALTPSHRREPLLLIALSARMLADLATRDGQPVVAFDLFGDLDLRRAAPRRGAPAA